MPKKFLQFILGLIIFVLIISFTDYSALKDISFKLEFFSLVITFSLFIAIISALKWAMITNYFAREKILPFYKYFFYLLLSRVVAYFNFKDIADFGIRTGSLRMTKKIGLYKSFNSVFFDRLIEFFIAFLLAIPCLFFFTQIIGTWTTIYLMISIFLLIFIVLTLLKFKFLVIISKFLNLVIKVLSLVPYLKNKFIKNQIFEQNKEIELPNYLFLKIIGLNFIKFIFTVLRIYFIFLTLSIEIPLIFIFVSIPLVQISGVFAFTPGGLGILEAGWLILLKLLNISSADISIFLVGQRILIFISTLIITSITFIFYLIKNKIVLRKQ